MTVPEQLPDLDLLLPEGWVRLRMDDTTAFAASSPGAAFTAVGGRDGIRIASDIAGEKDVAGEWMSFPRRRVTTIVAPSPGEEWLVFFAEIVVPPKDAEEIVAACEFFVDAMLQSVRFPTSAVEVVR